MIESRAQDNGRKRHIAVDATGLLLAVVITAASVQDRDAARPLLWNLHRTSRRIRLIWADCRLHRQAGHLGRGHEDGPPDRPQAQPARLRGACPAGGW